jgi:type VI secretion system protein VasJ
MLGTISTACAFQWTIAGKHPAAADFIRLGAQSAVLDAVANWVAKGYDAVQQGRHSLQTGCSWRFWLRGAKKQTLICGLCRDSSDRIGRPYPFLIMGEGILKGMDKTWPVLPAQLEKVWSAMEYIAAHRFDDLQVMADEFNVLDMAAAANRPVAGSDRQACLAVDGRMDHCRDNLLTSGWGLISLSDGKDQDLTKAAVHCHARLQECCSDIPRAVFLGGPARHSYIMVLQQPLTTYDFIRLWTM